MISDDQDLLTTESLLRLRRGLHATRQSPALRAAIVDLALGLAPVRDHLLFEAQRLGVALDLGRWEHVTLVDLGATMRELLHLPGRPAELARQAWRRAVLAVEVT